MASSQGEARSREVEEHLVVAGENGSARRICLEVASDVKCK